MVIIMSSMNVATSSLCPNYESMYWIDAWQTFNSSKKQVTNKLCIKWTIQWVKRVHLHGPLNSSKKLSHKDFELCPSGDWCNSTIPLFHLLIILSSFLCGVNFNLYACHNLTFDKLEEDKIHWINVVVINPSKNAKQAYTYQPTIHSKLVDAYISSTNLERCIHREWTSNSHRWTLNIISPSSLEAINQI